ncbi:MAG TPA: glycoside hydrolase family 3 protein [Acidiferrobacteraceae bacterium]|nr:glycoside hydrolase family 3 protein [Acidiferrobacteraceae bacterium]HEX19543.1 glycoside hydrolase family 3 protein [Acidiferrobacteraceae bacterium]
MKPRLLYNIVIALLLGVVFFPGSALSGEGTPPNKLPLTKKQLQRIDNIVQRMSLRDKVGQMIMCSILGKKMNPRLRQFLRDVKPGGLTIFNYNFKSSAQLRKLNLSLFREFPDIRPFLAIDQEGGAVTRIKEDMPELPGNMALGAAGSIALSRRAGEVLGEGLSAHGFNMNLAPVLDINTNPKNPVIGVRSFSSDARLVGDLGSALINGLQSRGVVAVGKHFPGHGDTSGDSHAKLPVLNHSSKFLKGRELIPFVTAIRKGNLNVIMTAHIALPGLHQGRPIPATLSHKVLTDILRNQMSYQGIIMTDGLEMRGLIGTAGTMAAASVRAVKAGADMISINADPLAVYRARDALLRAVQQGNISRKRIDASVKRILATKLRYGVLDRAPRIYAPNAAQKKRYYKLSRELSLKSATLIKNRNDVLPITDKKYRSVFVVGPSDFVRQFRSRSGKLNIQQLVYKRGYSTDRLVKLFLQRNKVKPDIVVVALRNADDTAAAIFLKQRLKKPMALVSLGSPYLFARISMADAQLGLFSNTRMASIVAADIVRGRNAPTGKLPVTIPGLYPFGHSLTYSIKKKTASRLSQMRPDGQIASQ